jgi:hypothetical protein
MVCKKKGGKQAHAGVRRAAAAAAGLGGLRAVVLASELTWCAGMHTAGRWCGEGGKEGTDDVLACSHAGCGLCAGMLACSVCMVCWHGLCKGVGGGLEARGGVCGHAYVHEMVCWHAKSCAAELQEDSVIGCVLACCAAWMVWCGASRMLQHARKQPNQHV